MKMMRAAILAALTWVACSLPVQAQNNVPISQYVTTLPIAGASLETYVDRIKPELVASVGAGPAKIMLEAFSSAVMGEKHTREALAAMGLVKT